MEKSKWYFGPQFGEMSLHQSYYNQSRSQYFVLKCFEHQYLGLKMKFVCPPLWRLSQPSAKKPSNLGEISTTILEAGTALKTVFYCPLRQCHVLAFHYLGLELWLLVQFCATLHPRSLTQCTSWQQDFQPKNGRENKASTD